MALANASAGEIGVDVRLREVVVRDDIVAPTFLVEEEEGLRSLGVVVADAHGDRSGHPSEAVDQHAEQRPTAQVRERRGVDTVEQRPGLRGAEFRGLAALEDVLGSPHRTHGVEGEHLADDP